MTTGFTRHNYYYCISTSGLVDAAPNPNVCLVSSQDFWVPGTTYFYGQSRLSKDELRLSCRACFVKDLEIPAWVYGVHSLP